MSLKVIFKEKYTGEQINVAFVLAVERCLKKRKWKLYFLTDQMRYELKPTRLIAGKIGKRAVLKKKMIRKIFGLIKHDVEERLYLTLDPIDPKKVFDSIELDLMYLFRNSDSDNPIADVNNPNDPGYEEIKPEIEEFLTSFQEQLI